MAADPAALSPLANWENYYVIVGSSAGALTGLQFVVIALIAEGRKANSMLEIRAFGSPTVFHFCAVLVISAILSAPWGSLLGPSVSLGIAGGAGFAYSLRVIQHARKQMHYSPDAEDWFWYSVLPLLTYGALLAAAIALPNHAGGALFAVAAISLSLLLIGIHNAWDTVTYIAVEWRRNEQDE